MGQFQFHTNIGKTRHVWPDKTCLNCGRVYTHEQLLGEGKHNSFTKWMSRKYCSIRCRNNGRVGRKVEIAPEYQNTWMQEHHVDREIIDLILLREEVRELEEEFWQ